MFREMYHDILSVLWVIVIIIHFYLAFQHYKKYRKLGRLILQNKSRDYSYLIIAIIFLVISVQNIISYLNYREIYLLITSTGMFISAITMFVKGIKKTEIYENGIITKEAIIMWDNILVYKWINRNSKCNKDLLLLTNYKVLLFNRYNKKFNYAINEEDIKTIQAILDTKGISDNKI